MKKLPSAIIIVCFLGCIAWAEGGRIRDYGIHIGVLKPGEYNAITDVKGVAVGHKTLIKGDSIRTGVTAIIPHPGNIFQEKVPAAIEVINGYGKLSGSTQVNELGSIETPILLTNTLNTPIVADALIEYMLNLKGNESVYSVNPVVGETNDSYLNDIRSRPVTKEDVFEAIRKAKPGPVAEGSVGAGTATHCLGFKGGIGTSSRVLPQDQGGFTVGVLVQTNFGGSLTINGAPVGRELNRYYKFHYSSEGSCMIVVATDAPLSHRNLKRLAKRVSHAIGRVGGYSSNGSGDYVIAFSTFKKNRIPYDSSSKVSDVSDLHNDHMSPLFVAVNEATEEAILNSIFKAKSITGRNGRIIKALPINDTLSILKKYKALNWNQTIPPGRTAASIIGEIIADSGIRAAWKKYKKMDSLEKYKLLYSEQLFNRLGYNLLKRDKIKEAIAVFQMNVKSFPESSNVYDSLADAYMKNNQTKIAIRFYKKSLQLDPGNQYALKMLEKLKTSPYRE